MKTLSSVIVGATCQRRSPNSTLEEDIVQEDFPGGEWEVRLWGNSEKI